MRLLLAEAHKWRTNRFLCQSDVGAKKRCRDDWIGRGLLISWDRTICAIGTLNAAKVGLMRYAILVPRTDLAS
jgi:hypothetical protein